MLRAEPLERVELGIDPAALLEQVRSGDEGAARILRRLGFEGFRATDARLVSGQLDDDSEPESILAVDITMILVVCVLDRSNAVWFSTGCTSVVNDLSEGFALRRVTSSNYDDLVTESGGIGCGGGYCAHSTGIFHLAGGRLYEVFRENSAVTTLCYEKSVRIQFPTAGMIVIRSETTGRGAPPLCGPVRREKACTAYRWNLTDRKFSIDRDATKKRCGV